MGREEGGGFRMGNTGIPVADSFRYLAKLIQYCKIKKKKKCKKKKKEFWSRLPSLPPGDLPNPGIEPRQISCIAGGFFTV